MKPVCLYITLNDSAVGLFVLFLPKGLFWFRLFSSPFVSMFSFSSPFERPAFCLSLSCLSSALCLSTYYPPFIPPVAQVSRPLPPCSSYQPNVLLPSDPSPTSLHPSLSLSPSPPLSRDNYYKPSEDQLVFKQLNKQGLGVLTVTIQQQSSVTVEEKIIVCVQLCRGHLKTPPWTYWCFLIVSPVMSNTCG